MLVSNFPNGVFLLFEFSGIVALFYIKNVWELTSLLYPSSTKTPSRDGEWLPRAPSQPHNPPSSASHLAP